MKEYIVGENTAGQRFDKFLLKVLKGAPSSFIYKMLRKKNIVLNGKKADGSEKLNIDDTVKIFLSDETFLKFSGSNTETQNTENAEVKASKNSLDFDMSLEVSRILYEDKHILLYDKPEGALSQKAAEGDISVNEQLIAYMLKTEQLEKEELKTFKPSICNRLDRNTTGLLVCGKSLPGLQEMNRLFHTREIHKFYRCMIFGKLRKEGYLDGYLKKDERTNKVTFQKESFPGADPIRTGFATVWTNGVISLLEIELITGKTHQIRSHLASLGTPIIGDSKYGNRQRNEEYKSKYGITSQMLHSYRLEFPELTAPFQYLGGQKFTANMPPVYQIIMKDGKQEADREAKR